MNTRMFQPVNRSLSTLAILFLGVILVACGGGTGAPGDGIDPSVQISSPDTSLTASYELTGVALDNVGVTGLQYTLAGGTEQAMTATGNAFSANLTLAAGANEITVTASDAAGNQGSDTITVNYLAAPSGVTSSQSVAARGDSIVITGSDFGATGDVTIGGVSVATDTWSDGEITLTIPSAAPGGPQTVTVSSPYGESSFEIFVGVVFEPGTLDDLAAAGHPKGTAVLLSEGTYTQTAAAVELDNLSLYGQGVDLTIVDTGGLPNTLTLFADVNEHVTLADLTLVADTVFVATSAPGPIAPLGAAGLDAADIDASINLLNELVDSSLEQYGSGSQLETQAGGEGSFNLLNLKLEEVAGGFGFVTASLAAPLAVLGSDINIESIDFDATASMLALITSGDISVQSTLVDSSAFILLSLNGAIDVAESELSSSVAAGPLGTHGMIYSDGLRIVDSTVRAYPPSMYIAPTAMLLGGGSPFFPLVAPLEITGSTFRMLDIDPAVAPDTGSMTIAASGGESHISGNTFIIQRDLVIGAIGGSMAIYDNTMTMGHAAIATSSLAIGSVQMPAFVEFTANAVTWLNEGGMELDGNYEISVHENTFTGAGTGTALSINQDSDSIHMNTTVQNNDFVNFQNALAIDLPGAGSEPFDLTLSGNHFDFPIDAAGKVAVLTDVVEATLDVDGNTWGEETDLVTLNSYITEAGTTTPGIMEITAVLTP